MPGTLCLTFDDLFVENWVAARPIFGAFGARVTFCISHLHMATQTQIDGLHLLQQDGHDIAFHTRTHPRLAPYLKEHGLDHWLEHEVDKGIAEHRALGFPARVFACPFHASTRATRTGLAKRFDIIRTDGPRGFDPGDPNARIYHDIPRNKCLANMGFADMQHRAFPGWPHQLALLKLVAQNDGTAVFCGHDIRTTKSGKGFYSTQKQIRRLLQAADRHKLRVALLPSRQRKTTLPRQSCPEAP